MTKEIMAQLTNDEILHNFTTNTMLDLLSTQNPVLWGELYEKALELYREAVVKGEIPRV